MSRKNIAAAGEDQRIKYAVQHLNRKYNASEWTAFKEGEAHVLLVPPVYNYNVEETEKLFGKLRRKGLLLSGKLSPEIKAMAEKYSLSCVNYMQYEPLTLANAEITAEAAIWKAAELTGRTINGSTVLVTGYGRIGKYLTRKLTLLGAKVTVAARKESCREAVRLAGAESALIPIEPLLVFQKNIIFNTVPSEIFTESLCKAIEPETVFVDLASAPFGIKEKSVQNLKFNYIRATGLPPYVTG